MNCVVGTQNMKESDKVGGIINGVNGNEQHSRKLNQFVEDQ